MCDREIDGTFCPFDGTPLAHVGRAPVLPEVGEEIEGRYKLIEELGRGGMAVVFRALNLTLGHDVALKVLRPRWASDRNTVARFAREARATSQIDHENIVKVYDFGWAERGYYFLAMELLAGRPLRAEIEGGNRLSPARAIFMLSKIADGMARAHEVGVVHRDLKPENVMVRRSGGRDYVTIVDFGLSKLTEGEQMVTREGDVIGTPDYMAPEQWKGTGVDARADVYAFGVLAYELLSGELPFQGETIVAKLQQHLAVEPLDLARHPGAPHVPPELTPIVMKCLAKDTLDRFPHMGRVKLLLEPIAEAFAKEHRAQDARSTVPAPMATVFAPIEETALDRRELLEEIGRLRRVRQHRLAEITPNVFGGDPPPAMRALIAAIEAAEAAADALGEEAALADASLEEAQRARRQKEAELRAGLIEANLQLAVLREALPGHVTAPGKLTETMEMASSEVLLDEPVEDVDSARRALARAERRLGDFAGAKDEAVEDATRRLSEANAASSAAEAELARHYERLERELFSTSPAEVMELSELDRALSRYRGRLEHLDRDA
jgi:hypothetical protein